MADPVDLSHLSDADLQAIAAGGKPAATAAPPHDLMSHMSDADLEKIAGGKWERGTILPIETNSAKPGLAGIRPAVPGFLKNIGDSVALPADAATGKVDLDSPEGWQRIVDFGTLFSPGSRAVNPGKLVTPAGKTAPDAVTNALRRDRINPAAISEKTAELGPAGLTADLGPNTKALTAGVATTPGPGQTVVVDALTKRQAGAPERIRGALDENLGAAPVPRDFNANLTAQRKALGPEYEKALEGAQPVDTSALAATLDQAIPGLRGEAQAQLQRVRKMLNKADGQPVDAAAAIAAESDPVKRLDLVRRHLAGEDVGGGTPLDTDPRTLLATRQAIDGIIDSTSDSNVQRVLGDARKSIDATLAASAPGIKAVDAKYADIARTRENFEKGQTVLGNGRDAPRPAELQADVTKAVVPEGGIVGPTGQAFALTQGARAEIDRIVGTNLNDRAALNSLLKGEGDWNYARLSTLFGKEKTDAIYKVLQNEHQMATTENMALAGSKTAAVQAAQKEVQPQGTPGFLKSAGDFHFGTALAGLKDAIMRGHAEGRQAATNEDIANILMGRDNLQRVPIGRQPPVPITAITEALERGQPPQSTSQRQKQRAFLNDQRVY
jgi:hypothetical protein